MEDQESLPEVFSQGRARMMQGLSTITAVLTFTFFLAFSLFLASYSTAQVTGDETIDSIAMSGPLDFSALNCTLADPAISNSITQQLSDGFEVNIRFRMFLRFESSLLGEEIGAGQEPSMTSAYLGAIQFSSPLAASSSSAQMASTQGGAERVGDEDRDIHARELSIPVFPGAGGGTSSAAIQAGGPMDGLVFSLLLSDHQVNPYHSLNSSPTSEAWPAHSWGTIPNMVSYVHLQAVLSNIPSELLPLVNSRKLSGWQFDQSDIPFSNAVLSHMTCRFESLTSPGEVVLARISGIWEQTNFFIFQVEIL